MELFSLPYQKTCSRKAKKSHNRGYAMEYSWLRDEISVDAQWNIHGYVTFSLFSKGKLDGKNWIIQRKEGKYLQVMNILPIFAKNI